MIQANSSHWKFTVLCNKNVNPGWPLTYSNESWILLMGLLASWCVHSWVIFKVVHLTKVGVFGNVYIKFHLATDGHKKIEMLSYGEYFFFNKLKG